MNRVALLGGFGLPALGVMLGCAQVAGVTSHQIQPDTDAGGDVVEASVDAAESELDPNPWSAIPEQCNFVDDNHDGSCDEGFDWTPGAWQLIYSGTAIRSVDAVRVVSGQVAVTVLEGDNPTASSKVVLAQLGADAAIVRGPIDVLSSMGTLGVGLATTADGEIGVGVKPATGASCDGGSCPIVVYRHAAADLSFLGTIAMERSALLPTLVATKRLIDLGWTAAGYVALAVDDADIARLLWQEPLAPTDFTDNKPWNGAIDDTKPYGGSLAIGPVIGYGLFRVGTSGQEEAVGGMSTLGSYRQILRPTALYASGGGNLIPEAQGRKVAAWSGSDLIVMVPIKGPLVSNTQLYRLRLDGQTSSPLAVSALPELGYSLVGADDKMLATMVSGGGIQVRRLNRAVLPMGKSIQVDDTVELAIAAGQGTPVFVRVSSDRKQVFAAALRCE
jgi:hypothetical protein